MQKQPVHKAAWIGLIVNFVVMLGALIHINEEALYYYDYGYPLTYGMGNIDIVFSLIFIVGFALSLVGVVMLAMGNPAGGIIGAIGSVAYVPIGMICMFGCMQTRSQMQLAAYHHAQPGSGGQVPGASGAGAANSVVSGRPQAVANKMDAAAVKSLSQAASVSATYGQPESSAQPDFATSNSGATTFSSQAAQAYFGFADYRWMLYLMIGIVVVGIFMLMSVGNGRIPGTIFLPIAATIPMLIGYSRVAKLPVFALYEDYLEITPNMYAQLIRIPYSDILSAKVKRNVADLEVRKPDGSIDKKMRVGFGFIKGSERKAARETFERKMRELGKLVA